MLLPLFYANFVSPGCNRRVRVARYCSPIEKEETQMLEKVVRLAVNMTPHPGKLEEFKTIAAAMTAGSNAEPGTVGYEWFASADGKRYRLLETYVDAAAVEAHFTGSVVGKLVPKLAALCSIDGFEIYGDPGPKVREMAGAFGAVFYQYTLGIDR